MIASALVLICDDCGARSKPAETTTGLLESTKRAGWLRVGLFDMCRDCAPAYRKAMAEEAS